MLPITESQAGTLGLRRAQVVCVDDERYRARLCFVGDEPGFESWAEIAVPDPARLTAGTRVLVARTEDDAWVVLAILGRPAPQPLVVEQDGAGATRVSAARGDLVLCAPAGDVRLEASRTVAIHGPRLAADLSSVDVRTGRASVQAQELRSVARKYRARFGDADLQARQWRLSATRIVTRARNLYEKVEGLSQRTAERARTMVGGLWQLSAGRLVARARGTVRIDGDKINLG